jgi:sugar/nucleoside kinase (ribokinase family)
LKKNIIHTDGKNGCYFNDINFPVDEVDVKDSCGAGDSFMAGLVIEYLKTNNIHDAIKFANKCASYVVSHRGVTLIP